MLSRWLSDAAIIQCHYFTHINKNIAYWKSLHNTYYENFFLIPLAMSEIITIFAGCFETGNELP